MPMAAAVAKKILAVPIEASRLQDLFDKAS
jgi:hypothetical protein